MNLTKIKLKNWQSFQGGHEINIPTGLVRITGLNKDNQGAISNRSGKTSLLNSIIGSCYGKTPLISTSNKLINEISKSGYVGLVFDNDFDFTRFLKDPKYNNFILTGCEEILTQESLEQKLGMGFDAFVSTVFFGTNYSDFLEKILRKPTEAKELLTSLLPDLKVFDSAWDWIKEQLGACNIKLQELELKSTNINGKIQSLINLNYEQKINDWNENYKNKLNILNQELKNFKEKYNSIKIEISIEKANKEVNKLNSKIKELETIDRNLYNTINSINNKINNLNRDSKRIEQELVSFKIGKCPTCGQEVSDKKLKQERSKQLENITKEIRELQGENELNTDELNEILTQLEKEKTKLRELDSSLHIVYEKDSMEKQLISKQEELNKAEEEINPWIDEKKKTRELINNYNSELDKINSQKKQLSELKEYYNFWQVGFGSRGIKNFVFDEIVFKLTDRTQEYLNFMTEGTIKIRFDPRKQKKTGGFTETIGLEVYNESDPRDFFTWSASERKKVSLATSLAMNQLLRDMFHSKLDFMVFDEAFDGLDEVGIDGFCRLLKTMLGEIKTILVVTHNPYAEELFDSTITVIKENGCSHVESKKLLRRK
jgi:DNA repair exonuclease SbcCD ATPase subunit